MTNAVFSGIGTSLRALAEDDEVERQDEEEQDEHDVEKEEQGVDAGANEAEEDAFDFASILESVFEGIMIEEEDAMAADEDDVWHEDGR